LSVPGCITTLPSFQSPLSPIVLAANAEASVLLHLSLRLSTTPTCLVDTKSTAFLDSVDVRLYAALSFERPGCCWLTLQLLQSSLADELAKDAVSSSSSDRLEIDIDVASSSLSNPSSS
jgi:hypothetical protein